MKPKKKNTVDYIVFGILLYLMLIFVTMHATAIMQENPDIELLAAINGVSSHIMHNPFDVAINLDALGGVTMAAFCVAAYFYIDEQRNHHDAAGIEAGSAKWNEDIKGYNKKYAQPEGKAKNAPDGKSMNMIMSQHIRLNMDGRLRNNNVVVFGGSGTGKSRFVVKPNILQFTGSYVLTDPKGELLESCGNALEKAGYDIKVFDLLELEYSNHYNPFHYLHKDEDVTKMVNTLITNTTPKGSGSGDPFWVKSETALLTAICLYLWHRCPEEDCNWGNVIKLLELAEVDEDNAKALSTLDVMFKILETDTKLYYQKINEPYEPDLATRQYHIYKMAAGKTAKSILISCGVRLAYFQMGSINKLTQYDDIDLTTIGDKKTALFCIISASDTTLNFLVSMLYTQLFDELYLHAQNKFGGRLPYHVRFLLDEFANVGQIPNFDKLLATMRSYKISSTVILQSLGQLKTLYKDEYNSIIGNCDTMIFLGGNDEDTTKYISGRLGKATITGMSHGRSIGGKGGSNKNFSQQGRDLMSPDELGMMDNRYCIVQLRGEYPFFDKKYNYVKHPNYHLTGDANKKQIYPFRQIISEKKKEQEALAKAEAAQRAELKKKRENGRRRRDEEFAKFREAAAKEKQPVAVSIAGHRCLRPQDAEQMEKKNQNMQEEFYDAFTPAADNFDSEFEFRDGIEGYSLDDAIADCKQLILQAEEEPVEAVESFEPPAEEEAEEEPEEENADDEPFDLEAVLNGGGLDMNSFTPPDDAENF